MSAIEKKAFARWEQIK